MLLKVCTIVCTYVYLHMYILLQGLVGVGCIKNSNQRGARLNLASLGNKKQIKIEIGGGGGGMGARGKRRSTLY